MENSNTLVLESVNRVHSRLGLSLPTRKRTRGSTATHNEEWNGPCARCYVQSGSAGEDRLIIWPDAPAYGARGRGNYPLHCRRCNWYGDVISYAADAFQWRAKEDFAQTLSFLGIEDTSIKKSAKPVELRPSHPPTEAWQRAGEALVKEAYSLLWSPEGAESLAYLHSRGLSDEIIQQAHLGCIVSWSRYDSPAEWGLDGNNIRIPPGIVIPEYHRDKDGNIELWSISIRLDSDYIELEREEKGDSPGKYHFVRGGVKGAYGYESLKKDGIAILCEGQFDALSVLQACGNTYGVVATQSASGGRDPRWLARLAFCSIVICCFDDDEAGREAMAFWIKVLDGTGLPLVPEKHDMNGMLMAGQDIKRWIEEKLVSYGVLLQQPTIEIESHVQDEPEMIHLDPKNPQISAMASLPTLCFICGRDATEHIDEEFIFTAFGDLLCPSCSVTQGSPKCVRCDNPSVYVTDDSAWCADHVTCAQVMEHGKQLRFAEVNYEAGRGHYFVNAKPCAGDAKAGHIDAGQRPYLEFCCQADMPSVGLALYELHLIVTRQKKAAAPKRVVKQPCARKDCPYDATVPYLFWPEHQFKTERGVQYGNRVRGAMDSFGNHWCPRCLQCMHLLDEAERLAWPEYTALVNAGGEMMPRYLKRAEDWIAFVKEASLFEVTVVRDELRRHV